MVDGKKPNVGRPRSDAAREAILDAAYWRTMELGYPAVTMDTIAKAAGAGKQTLYRWWPGKPALILESFVEKARTRIDRPQEAAIRARDLTGFLKAIFAFMTANGPVLRHLMAEAQSDPKLRDLLKEWLVQPQRNALRLVLEGPAPDGARSENLVAAIDGAIWQRLLLGEPLDPPFAEALASLAATARRA